ncbi:MAG: putative rane protein, partial [Myxococcaceae bacterium]|nr:putative rane protein [Myxococcaceae bacterium]
MNLLEPWVLLRLVSGLVACLLFARGAMTAQKVLRHFELGRATEGQLALEKQIELSATFVRIGAVVQVLALVLSVLGADRMSRGVRGAMCAYGVFGANEWGFRSLAVTGGVALFAGV